MKRNKFFSRFITVTLTVALLLVSGSRAIRVSALADPSPEIWLSPIYDTTIYQFSDYVENLSDPQYEIFKIALGIYACTQMGSNKYQLIDPFDTRDGIIGWFKSTGLQLYNSIIGIIPDITVDPVTGNIISTSALKEEIKFLVAYGMGAAVLAANYQTEQDFIDDIDNSTNFFIKYGVDIQPSIKDLIAINGGFYRWQFTSSPFVSNHSTQYFTGINSATALGYYNFLGLGNNKIVRVEWGSPRYNFRVSSSELNNYNILFFDVTTNQVFLCDEFGNKYYRSFPLYEAWTNDTGSSYSTDTLGGSYWPFHYYDSTTAFDYFNLGNFNSIVEGVQNYFDTQGYESPYFFISDFVDQVYYGVSWESRIEVTNTTDLNLSLNDLPYYNQLQTDYLFDIKQYIQDLLNNVDLYTPWINNLFTPDGIRVTDPQLIRVTTQILDIVDDANPPLPVNLNDIAEYTDNTYLDVVKERATAAGNTLAALVAFWHNCDAELIYVLFGAGITVLVGAFIGKWGHS